MASSKWVLYLLVRKRSLFHPSVQVRRVGAGGCGDAVETVGLSKSRTIDPKLMLWYSDGGCISPEILSKISFYVH
jgi:hypothetical protein